MKSMQIGLSSSSKSPLGRTAVASANGHGEIKVSSDCMMKAIRVRLNPLSTRKLICTATTNKYVTEVYGNDQKRKTKAQAKAASASTFTDNEHDSVVVVAPQSNEKSILLTLHAIYKYAKIYTLQGTLLSIISISLLAIKNVSDFSPSFFLGVSQAMLGSCLLNSYVAGINQLSDIEIDKVNKPHLPLPSGELSFKTGVLVTLLYATLSFFVGWSVKSLPLKLGLSLGFFFGTAYSVNIPLLRWKRDPVLSAICVWAAQGVIIPILFYLHAQMYINGRTLLLSKHAIFVSGIMSIFAIVHALFKDIPDVEGDKKNGINSLASLVGKKEVFWICIWLLEMAYGVAILVGLSSTRLWIRSIMVIGHGILGFLLWRKANLVDMESNEAIESFYLFIWKLYSIEYLLVPILRF